MAVLLGAMTLALVGGDPGARRYPTVTAIGSTRYVAVMGGESDGGALLDDLHLFDHERLLYLPSTDALAPRQDIRVQSREYEDDERSGRPPARRNHAACSDGGTKLFVFGGFGLGTRTSVATPYPADRLLNDLHVFDVATMRWSGEHSARAGRPARRWGHSLTRVGSRCYVFGGSTDVADALAIASTARAVRNDVHYFACAEGGGGIGAAAGAPYQWVAPAVVGAPPAPRLFFSAAAVGAKLYVFGGEKPSNGDGMACARYNDLWALDTMTHAWSRIADGGFGAGGLDSLQPATRAHHTLLASGTVLLLTGGVDGLYHKTLDDAWTFETDAAQPGAGAWAGLKNPVAHSRVATQQATNRALEPRSPDGTTTRLQHGTAVDAAGTGRIFVFGGTVHGVLANSMDIYSGAAARMQWLYQHVSSAA